MSKIYNKPIKKDNIEDKVDYLISLVENHLVMGTHFSKKLTKKGTDCGCGGETKK